MKQKRLFGIVTAVMMLVVSLTSCHWFGRVEETGNKDLQFCSVEFEDSVKVFESTAYQKLDVVFPVEEDTSRLAQNVLSWLCEQVSKCSYPDWSGEWIDKELSLETVTPMLSQYEGSFAESLVNFYAQKGLDKMKESLSEEAAEGFEGSYLNELEIGLDEQTDGYLTLSFAYDVYLGGAHGSRMEEGITFRKSDGKRLGWEIFDMDKRAELIEKVKAGLKDYFGDVDEENEDSDAELFDHLMILDDPDTPENELEFGIPLPRTAPWLTKDGFVFIYQQYEIAAYAYGMPSFTIPAKELLPLLTEEGQAWLSSVIQ